MDWGQCVIAGVAGKGRELNVIPRYLITGRRIAGRLVRQGARPATIPARALYLEGQAPLDAFISHHRSMR